MCVTHSTDTGSVVSSRSASTPSLSSSSSSSTSSTISPLKANPLQKDEQIKQIERKKKNSSILFKVVMTLAATTVFSTILQLEKVFYYHSVTKPISDKISIPILSSLAFQESMVLCGVTIFFLGLFIYYQLQLLTDVRMNMSTVRVSTQLPFLGTALEFLSNTPWDLMESWHRTYGPIYKFRLLGRNMVSIEHPDHLKEVLQSKIQNVKKDVEFAYKPFLPILGRGIVTSEGKSWMDQRRKISGALKVDILEEIPRATLEAVKRLMVKMDKIADSEDGETIDIAEELRHLTLQVISGTFMSLEAEESDNTFATMYLPIVEEGNKRVWRPERSYMIFAPFFWRYIFGVRRLNNYVSDLIQKRWDLRLMEKKNTGVKGRKEGRVKDILDKVLDHFEKDNPKKPLSWRDIRQLRDEFKTFMLAGHETSAAMMTWAFYELMQDSQLMKEVESEAISVFDADKDWLQSDNESLPPRTELSKLILSEACLKESLRKYSVVPSVIRHFIKPTQIGNHHIPKGTSVVINIQSTHHNEAFWPNPMSFDPSRFLDPNKRPAPFTFIPFIDGPRNCLGQYLALLESKMVISLIAQRYTMKMKDEVNPDEDPRHRFMVPLIPKDSMDIYVSKKFH